jgi:hypothetical protein
VKLDKVVHSVVLLPESFSMHNIMLHIDTEHASKVGFDWKRLITPTRYVQHLSTSTLAWNPPEEAPHD